MSPPSPLKEEPGLRETAPGQNDNQLETENNNTPAVVEEGFGCLAPSFNFELVKESPELLSRFLQACVALKPLERDAREAALAFVQSGKAVPCVQFAEGRTSTEVGAEAILEAVDDPSPKRLIANLRAFVHVVCPIPETAYKLFCKKIGALPQRSHIKRHRGAPFVTVMHP
jgi:hypothetical protein